MDTTVKLRQIALALGDLLLFYIALFLTLIIRYQGVNIYPHHLATHLLPFTFIFLVWIVSSYIAGLYDVSSLKNEPSFYSRALWTFGFNAVIALLFFYLTPFVAIAPKTNLLIFLIVGGTLAFFWRMLSNFYLNKLEPSTNLLLIGTSSITEEIVHHINNNPQLGYRVGFWMKQGLHDSEFSHLAQIILGNNISTIVVPAHVKKNSRGARMIYQHLTLGIQVIDLATLYENTIGKVPLSELEEVWFLDNLATGHTVYELVKRPLEFFVALVLLIATLPFSLFVAVVTLLTSRGPIIYSQKRVGRNSQEFSIYKFRTMRVDAEQHGPQWSQKKDARVTVFGKFLRRSHLDEIPQLINVLRGELSLIGPRPERPEFVEQLRKEIPYYDLRLLVRPGITGWAQVKYRYGASVEDAYQKLQYDIHYLKNRSLFIDFLIVLKTLKFFFSNL
jgi:exopolysaccharide biosynthesis polyprenyl glycosylphosphotransferase